MKILPVIAFLVLSVSQIAAQTATPTPTRARIVGASATPTPSKIVVITDNIPPAPKVTPTPIVIKSAPTPTLTPTPVPAPTQPTFSAYPQPTQTLPLGQIKARIDEAKRVMSMRPITIADTDGTFTTNSVRIAFYNFDSQALDFIVVPKDSFLTKDGQFFVTSTGMKQYTLRIVRPNGVNTPVVITDISNKPQLPLMVQYPVERGGRYYETAYYMSTHPGLVTPEVVNAGKFYVRNTIDIARAKLRERGFFIGPNIADMAERLSIVEHVDHYRFNTEYHPNVYNDIFALYALNEGQTYRYSVSSAGAGGMIQMIPSTYQLIRNRYAMAGLMPDFVEGMRNHVNAAQAMLLYIQMTYNDLVANPTVADALATGNATEIELLSAGYNSNPAKLPGYIKRGGTNWRALIPRETKIYLQINESINRYVPFTPRKS